MDGGTYTVFITATAAEVTAQPTIDTNSALSFQLTIVDPCETTLVNNIAASPTLNRGPTTI
jgi:hypothetical protein